MAEKKTIKVDKTTGKILPDNAKGDNVVTKYNMSLRAQDKVRVEYTRGRYTGTIEDVSELKAKRLYALKKAKSAKGKELVMVYKKDHGKTTETEKIQE